MKINRYLSLVALTFITLLSAPAFSQSSDPITDYYNKLKESKAKGGAETAFLSVGSDMLYALEYFEAKNYSSASYSFNAILRREPDNPYANYLYGVSLVKTGNDREARPYIEKATQLMPSLSEPAKAFLTKPAPPVKAPINEAATTAVNETATKTNGLDPVSAYYERLKSSKLKGDAETAFLSVGSDMLGALEYFEAQKFDYASWRFEAILKREPENPYANFLYGVSLAKLGKGSEAKPYIEKAARIMPALNDLAKSQIGKIETQKAKALQDERNEKASAAKPKPAAANKPSGDPNAGGKLVLGSYVCDYQQYQGNNGFGAAYKSVYQGYFLLKADGTYRWLDNGGTGKYSYDAKTGKITWLSGHMKTIAPLSTTFTDGQKVASIKVKFSDNYTWGCGCNK